MYAFGQLVRFLPNTGTKSAKVHQGMAPKTDVGLFLGYVMQPGGIWSGDFWVVPWSDLQDTPDAPPSLCSIYH